MRVKTEMDNDDQGMRGDDRGGRHNSSHSSEKLFVGGLSWETTQENLQRFFTRYGEVIDCVVMKNSESGRSRGFGFVTFSDPANVSLVLQNGPHQLDGRTIDPKPCNPRSLQKPKRSNSFPKVFLGGLPSNVTETDLRTYFTRFGKVMEVVIMYDQEKKKSRGFGFLSFEDDDAVDRCVAEHFVNMNGKQVEIKKAEPRDASGKMGDGPQGGWAPSGGPPMGMGGGMGMGGPNGQMGGPMGGPMGPMGPPGNMMQGYQGWGTPPQTQYPGYGPPSGQGGYQGWGAPPGQGQQMPPPQWGSSYGQPPQQQGYGGYGDMYGRSSAPGQTASAATGQSAPGAGAAQKSSNDYSAYGSYNSYGQQDSSSYGQQGRSYGGDASSQSGGGYGSHPPVPALGVPYVLHRVQRMQHASSTCAMPIGQGDASAADACLSRFALGVPYVLHRVKKLKHGSPAYAIPGGQGDASTAAVGAYPTAPGPTRASAYPPNAAQSFHPYRRM